MNKKTIRTKPKGKDISIWRRNVNVAVTDVAAIVTANVSLLWAKEEALVSAQIQCNLANNNNNNNDNKIKIAKKLYVRLKVCLISPATALDRFIDSPAYGIIAQGTFNHTKANNISSSPPMHCLYACIGKRDGISRRLPSNEKKQQKKKEKSNNNFDDAVNDVHSLQYLFCVSFMCELCCLLANYRLKLLLSAKMSQTRRRLFSGCLLCTARKTCNQMSDVEENTLYM
uniref:Uncharacterized protein n=1 Tax=Glossina austeni TaxID=7395 RepID=A0A1A9VQG6_GLOAU